MTAGKWEKQVPHLRWSQAPPLPWRRPGRRISLLHSFGPFGRSMYPLPSCHPITLPCGLSKQTKDLSVLSSFEYVDQNGLPFLLRQCSKGNFASGYAFSWGGDHESIQDRSQHQMFYIGSTFDMHMVCAYPEFVSFSSLWPFFPPSSCV